jgi:hypothetical protein
MCRKEMSRAEAEAIFISQVAYFKVLGGDDVKTRCLAEGVPEAIIDELIEGDRTMDKFIKKHDSKGNLKQ